MLALTPVGYPSYYMDMRSFHSHIFAGHLVSLLCEGTFEKFPSLRVVCVESGFLWALPLMWRLDRQWRLLRTEVPQVRRKPSEYIREHVSFTTQPFERPGTTPTEQVATRKQFEDVLGWMDAGHTLMFASDYPHWDGDYRPMNLFGRIRELMRDRILYQNALELYGLPKTRTADEGA
jgi:predicted TIM-barrel fold metal-dependent hydrolase